MVNKHGLNCKLAPTTSDKFPTPTFDHDII